MYNNKTKAKPGPKACSKHANRHTNNEWAMCCKTYLEGPKMTQKAFLQSECSGPKFTGTASEVVTFSNKLKLFKEGKLKASLPRRNPIQTEQEVKTIGLKLDFHL